MRPTGSLLAGDRATKTGQDMKMTILGAQNCACTRACVRAFRGGGGGAYWFRDESKASIPQSLLLGGGEQPTTTTALDPLDTRDMNLPDVSTPSPKLWVFKVCAWHVSIAKPHLICLHHREQRADVTI